MTVHGVSIHVSVHGVRVQAMTVHAVAVQGVAVHAMTIHASINATSGRIHAIFRLFGNHLGWSCWVTHWDDTTSSCDSLVDG
jgi:hypothetical protein